VVESDHVIVFEHDRRRNLARDDLAEQTVHDRTLHCDNSLQKRSYLLSSVSAVVESFTAVSRWPFSKCPGDPCACRRASAVWTRSETPRFPRPVHIRTRRSGSRSSGDGSAPDPRVLQSAP